MSPFLRHTVVLEPASSTAPVNEVPKRVVVTRAVSLLAIRWSAGDGV